jgi:3-oxoacyl-[acyl-carrier-protein] synthase-3
MAVKITGFGCYIPEIVRTNEDFLNHKFYTETGKDFDDNPQVIIKKFEQITGIKERRYVSDDLNVSDIALIAAQKAINDAKIDPETLDYIIVAHNFGDVKHGTTQTDILPSIGSRVKRFLKIKNHRTVAYDIIFGCPGWLQGSIQAKAFIESGLAKRCLVIGAETLSRVVDPHDRDSMKKVMMIVAFFRMNRQLSPKKNHTIFTLAKPIINLTLVIELVTSKCMEEKFIILLYQMCQKP